MWKLYLSSGGTMALRIQWALSRWRPQARNRVCLHTRNTWVSTGITGRPRENMSTHGRGLDPHAGKSGQIIERRPVIHLSQESHLQVSMFLEQWGPAPWYSRNTAA